MEIIACCVYKIINKKCDAKYFSKLRINDHWIQGCPNGPLDANGVSIPLPMWVNAYYGGPKNALKMSIYVYIFGVVVTFTMSFQITNEVFARIMCCTFFLIHYKTHSMKTLESNSKKYILKSTCEF
jgi:hypothetical protein